MINKNKHYYNCILKYGFLFYCTLLAIQIAIQFIDYLKKTIHHDIVYTSFEISDWFINYEGGFVRRGIIGEILLILYNEFNIDITLLIIVLSYTSAVALIILVISLFIRKRLQPLILPTIIVLGYFAINPVILCRRDSLMLLIIFHILCVYIKYLKNKKYSTYIYFIILNIFVILMHEASFFCYVPFLITHKYINDRNENSFKRMINTLIFLLPIIISMCTVCIFKGNQDTANSIWESYHPYFMKTIGIIPQMGDGIDALTWDTTYTINFHFSINYKQPIIPYIKRGYVWIILYSLIFYLCANVNRIELFRYKGNKPNSKFLIQTLILQFISLIPMFTVLSCDLGRIVMYWTISSFIIYALFENSVTETRIPVLGRIINTTHNLLNTKLLSNKCLYIIVVIIIICPPYSFLFPYVFYTSVIGNLYRIAQQIYALI